MKGLDAPTIFHLDEKWDAPGVSPGGRFLTTDTWHRPQIRQVSSLVSHLPFFLGEGGGSMKWKGRKWAPLEERWATTCSTKAS